MSVDLDEIEQTARRLRSAGSFAAMHDFIDVVTPDVVLELVRMARAKANTPAKPVESAQATKPAITGPLIPLAMLPKEMPTWPYSPWSTGNMIRQGQLGCVRVGKRLFVTRALLEQFIERNTFDL